MKTVGIGILLIASTLLASPLRAQQVPTPPEIKDVPASLGEAPYDFLMRQGYVAAKEGDYATASVYFRNALFEVPNDRDALTAYWNMQDALRSDSQAEEVLTGYDRHMEIGYDATEMGDYQTAQINFERALEDRPNDYYASQALRNVKTYINRGKTGAAAEGPQFYPGELPYDRHMRLGYAAMQRDDYQSAARQFRNALDVRPDDRQALIAFWNAMDVLDQGPKESRQASPEPLYDRLMRRGYNATDAKSYKKALDYFQKALKERPGDYYATQAIRNVSTFLSGMN